MLRREGVETFQAYCGSASDLSMCGFNKLCRDCKFIGKQLTSGDADVIFTGVVPKGQRRMNLQIFEDALRIVAEKLEMHVCEVCEIVEESEGPVRQMTKTLSVRLHDDKTTYTGTHLRGGPEPGRKGVGTADMSAWLATLRPNSASLHDRDSPRGSFNRGHSNKLEEIEALRKKMVARQAWCSLEDTFNMYCGSQPNMDGKNFTKLCKDAQLLGRNLTLADCDLIFANVLPRGHRRMELVWFPHALWHVAEKKGIDGDFVVAAVVAMTGKPSMNATQASENRFHDDKGTYTGTHVFGGPDVRPTVNPSMDTEWRQVLRVA